MVKKISIETLFEEGEGRILLDARSPAEFEHGYIPNALNLALFSNEERAIVGTAYKKESPEVAMLKGLDFVGLKMRFYVEEAERLAPKKKIVVHCWRGGKRSGSLAWLLDLAGFDVQVLDGGYKAYRNYILSKFGREFPKMIVLGGYTGSAKTEILYALQAKGEQFLDLEGIAHHKGSAFGSIGQKAQPTTEQFENNLFEQLSKIDVSKDFWIEDESRSIGRVYIPQQFWERMRARPVLFLKRPIEKRIEHLVKGYVGFADEGLSAAFEKIKKRLGGQHLNAALEALQQNDYKTAASIALKYYDKAYANSLQKRAETCEIIPFETEEDSIVEIAKLLLTKIKNDKINGI